MWRKHGSDRRIFVNDDRFELREVDGNYGWKWALHIGNQRIWEVMAYITLERAMEAAEEWITEAMITV